MCFKSVWKLIFCCAFLVPLAAGRANIFYHDPVSFLNQGSVSVLDSDNFRLISDFDGYQASEIVKFLEMARERFYYEFEKAGFELDRGRKQFDWICFSDDSRFLEYAWFADWQQISGLSGYYSPWTNRVALLKEAGNHNLRPIAIGPVRLSTMPAHIDFKSFDVMVVSHEAAHQLAFNSGLQERGVIYPLWLSEGLATNFEWDGTSKWGLCGSSGGDRAKRLADLGRSGELVSLRNFVGLARSGSFYGSRDRVDFYAQSWGLFRFLFENHRDGLKRYFAKLAKTGDIHRNENQLLNDFYAEFGCLDELEKQWNQYVLSLD